MEKKKSEGGDEGSLKYVELRKVSHLDVLFRPDGTIGWLWETHIRHTCPRNNSFSLYCSNIGSGRIGYYQWDFICTE